LSSTAPVRATGPAARPAARRAGQLTTAVTAAAVLAAALTSCAPTESADTGAAITITDPTGRTVSLDAPARRIVSMIPAVTEWVIAMDGADRLVARTDFDHHPAIDTLPSVGGGLTPSIEWLAARSPDLVIAWPDAPSRSIVARVKQVGIPVYSAAVESIEDALATARDIGVLMDEPRSADLAIARVRSGLDSVRAAVSGRPPPAVLYLIGLDPLTAAGPDTFVDELIAVAGGSNVLHDLVTRWPQLSLEEVIRRAPDVVIVGSVRAGDPAALLSARPGWRDVPAVRAGAVYAVDPDIMNRPGPGLAGAAASIASLIHALTP
jgi:ABC-type Fe3+-hydroxamate transport system substrate-binding protein